MFSELLSKFSRKASAGHVMEAIYGKVRSWRLTNRSSRSQMLFKIGVLKNLTIFTGKHLCWSLFLIKLLQAFSPLHKYIWKPKSIITFLLEVFPKILIQEITRILFDKIFCGSKIVKNLSRFFLVLYEFLRVPTNIVKIYWNTL